jgi:hypothetical protein
METSLDKRAAGLDDGRHGRRDRVVCLLRERAGKGFGPEGWLTWPACMNAFALPRRILFIHTVPAREALRIPGSMKEGKRPRAAIPEAPDHGD